MLKPVDAFHCTALQHLLLVVFISVTIDTPDEESTNPASPY